MVLAQMMICPWEGHLVSQVNLVSLTLPLCRPQCLTSRSRKLRYFLVWRIVGLLCNQVLNIITISTFVKKTKGKCTLKGHQARQKIAKEVGQSGYCQLATANRLPLGLTLSSMLIRIVICPQPRLESWRNQREKANGEAAAYSHQGDHDGDYGGGVQP
jgi:hypothetical protein